MFQNGAFAFTVYNPYFLPCRVLCIKYTNFVRHCGGKRLVISVCALTFIISLLFAIGLTVEIAIICPEITLKLSLRAASPTMRDKLLSSVVFIRIASLSILFLNLLEFFCYVIIFFEMYKHHKRHVKLCLSNKPKLANLKRRQNNITAVGHFSSWITEILIFAFLQYILLVNKESNPIFGVLFLRVFTPSINYLVFPTVQTMASKNLRSHVFSLGCCNEGCLCVECIKIENELEHEQNVPPVAQNNIQQFQLEVLQNGHAHHL